MNIITCQSAHEVALQSYSIFNNQLDQKPNIVLLAISQKKAKVIHAMILLMYLVLDLSYKLTLM
jgi:hypothetical protein